MATHLGKAGVIKAITATGTPAAMGEVKSFSIDTTCDTVEDTALGDAARTYKAGLKSATLSIEAHYDPSDAAQLDCLEGESIDFELLPEAGNKITGTAIVNSLSISNDLEGIVAVTIGAQVTGAIARAAVT